VFATVIYLQGFRVELPIKSARYRAKCNTYPIKLLYTGITPIIIHRVLVLYLYQASQILSVFGGNLLVDLLGVWSTEEDTQPSKLFFLDYKSGNTRYYPSGGLCYYFSAIGSHPGSIIDEPIHAIIYGTFMLCTCAFFSRISINMSGTSADEVAKQLMDKQMVLQGHQNKSIVHVLNQYIPTAAILGGLCIGALCVFADIFGAFESGANLIITITFINTYYEQIVKEQQEQSQLVL
jgi:protein transport protein SEC61 subunit alpha